MDQKKNVSLLYVISYLRRGTYLGNNVRLNV